MRPNGQEKITVDKNRVKQLGSLVSRWAEIALPWAVGLAVLAVMVKWYTGLVTAGAWRVVGDMTILWTGCAYLAYAAARARARVRHEAYSARIKRECDSLIAERDTLARKLSNRDQQAGELTDALERATRDLISSKSRGDGLAESLAESAQGLAHYWGKAREEDRFDPTKHQLPSLRRALELLDLLDRHTYRGDDGAEWQVTAFRDKPTDAFAYKSLPRLVIGKERLEAAPPGAIEFVEEETPALLKDPERPRPIGQLLAVHKLPGGPIPMSEVEGVSIHVSATPAADHFHRSQHQQAVDDDRRQNRRRYHEQRLETLDPDSPIAKEVGRDKLIEILQSSQTAGVQVAEVRMMARRLDELSGTLQLQKLGDEGNAPLPVVAEAAANVIGAAKTLATMLETAVDQRDQLLGRVTAMASNAQMEVGVLAEYDEMRGLVRQLGDEVSALRAMPAFGDQTELSAKIADLTDQMRRQLHMSGADQEEDATGN